jgi:hypothetical protein
MMTTRRLSVSLTGAALACASLAGALSFIDRVQAGKPAPAPMNNPAIVCQVGDAIWLLSADGTRSKQIAASGWAPTWSPDGKHIAFRNNGICVMNADGSNVRVLLPSTDPGYGMGNLEWTPDANYLILAAGDMHHPGRGETIIDVRNGARATIFPSTGLSLWEGDLWVNNASCSPDTDGDPTDGFQGYVACAGRWYDPGENIVVGGLVVYPITITTDWPDPTDPSTATVSATTGTPSLLPAVPFGAFPDGVYHGYEQPRWSHDGTAIAYLETTPTAWSVGTGQVGVVDVDIDPETGGILFGTPTVICDHWCATDTLGYVAGRPAWSSDDAWIAFDATSIVYKNNSSYIDVFRVPSDGSGWAVAVTNPADKTRALWPDWNPAWDPNGQP